MRPEGHRPSAHRAAQPRENEKSDNTFKSLANPTGPRTADMVNTTTNDGKTAPYIVRSE